MTHSKFRNSLYALALGAFVFTACNNDDDGLQDTPPPQVSNIAETVAALPDYSMLLGALEATDLVGTLQGEGPFTVFAPDNVAFRAFLDDAEIPAGTDDERLAAAATALGVEGLRQLLLYHVLGAEVRAADVPDDAYVTTASTNSPGNHQLSLRVQSGTTGVLLNGGTSVTTADLVASNGVIHGIDAVLPMPNVVNHALNNPETFSSLTAALVSADLVETLEGDGPFTVFAPTNAAFEAIASVTLTPEELVTVLTYHVVDGNVRSGELSNGNVTTRNLQDVTVTINGGSVTLTDSNDNVVNVVLADVQGTNGVVHVIDAVLLPQL